MRDIKFVTYGETIPTSLHLKVDDEITVTYGRIEGGFEFAVWDVDADTALEIVNDIVMKIKFEHDEPQHGISWETVSINITRAEAWCTVIEWKYRVRDSY